MTGNELRQSGNKRVRVVAVGDLQLGDSPTSVGYGFFSTYGSQSIASLFNAAKPLFAKADVVFANLETILVAPTATASSRGEFQLRGTPAFAADLKHVGVSVVNVANNHAVQHGEKAFFESVATVRAAGIACCGVRGTDGWTSEPVMLHDNTLGVLGYCMRPRQYGPETPPYAEGTEKEICADIRRLKATGATVAVSMHWGEEFVTRPSVAEVSLGHAIIDAGASLLLGHHPHVARPVERYNDGVIVYSMGNFMGDMTWYEPFRTGLVVSADVDGGGATLVSVAPTHLSDGYVPDVRPHDPSFVKAPGELSSLQEPEYQAAIAESMAAQRKAVYRSAVVNMRRMPLRTLVQMVAQTVINKVSALAGR